MLSDVHAEVINHEYNCAIDCMVVLDEINCFALTRGTTINSFLPDCAPGSSN